MEKNKCILLLLILVFLASCGQNNDIEIRYRNSEGSSQNTMDSESFDTFFSSEEPLRVSISLLNEGVPDYNDYPDLSFEEFKEIRAEHFYETGKRFTEEYSLENEVIHVSSISSSFTIDLSGYSYVELRRYIKAFYFDDRVELVIVYQDAIPQILKKST